MTCRIETLMEMLASILADRKPLGPLLRIEEEVIEFSTVCAVGSATARGRTGPVAVGRF